MSRFLLEVTHESDTISCARSIQLFLQTGSHYLTHADYGCQDGDHRAWIIIEAESKEEARNVLPPAYRSNARITRLNKFSLEEIGAILKSHGA